MPISKTLSISSLVATLVETVAVAGVADVASLLSKSFKSASSCLPRAESAGFTTSSILATTAADRLLHFLQSGGIVDSVCPSGDASSFPALVAAAEVGRGRGRDVAEKVGARAAAALMAS